MTSPELALSAALLAAGLSFLLLLVPAWRSLGTARARPTAFSLAVGFVTDFLDTLGIGSFATTTSAFRLARRTDDRVVPGTLNVGHTIPTIAQALLYLGLVKVESVTLVSLIGAAVAGAWLGSGLVSRWSRAVVRTVMGLALLVAAAFMGASLLSILPKGGEGLALSPGKLALGVLANFVLGALMTTGVGLYAPCMVLVSALGMNPVAAFPIMMGSCAFLMPAAGVRFVRAGAWDPSAALGLTLGGVPGVLVATYVVRALPLGALKVLVAAVVLYTAITLLVSARRSEPSTAS